MAIEPVTLLTTFYHYNLNVGTGHLNLFPPFSVTIFRTHESLHRRVESTHSKMASVLVLGQFCCTLGMV